MMNIYENNTSAIEALYDESLNEYFEKADLLKRLKYISDEFDKEIEKVEARLRPKQFQQSNLHKIFKVHERVRLVRNLKRQLEKGADTVQRFMYPGLRTYLLLTCFDQLGQNEWKFFPDWLNSEKSKIKKEREEILKKAHLKENITDAAGNANAKFIASVYNGYNEIYGVKKSFMNFLRDILPKEQREKLLNKIEIQIYEVAEGNFNLKSVGNDEDKEKWLYKTRNDYTHNLLTSEKHFTQGFFGIDDNWLIWEEIHSDKLAQKIFVAESFKKEIEQSVIIGIVEIIKRNS
ncbi:MAG: hypothetical protein SF053_04060 [Bacteroidia bacterium]|nr:hypothetical protein [Bacteroidia bacterium]